MPLCRDHPLFTVHSVAVLAFLVDVLLAARSSPAELPIGLSDFLPHILVPHPDDVCPPAVCAPGLANTATSKTE